MNYREIRDLVHYGLREDPLLGVIPNAVNEALRTIQARRSWGPMRTRPTVTVPADSDRGALPAGYKELQGGHTPALVIGMRDRFPVRVLPEGEGRRQSRYTYWPYTDQEQRGPLSSDYCWIELGSDGLHYVVFPRKFTEETNVEVDIYAYLDKLTADDDENFFTTEFPSMLVALTKYNVGQYSEDEVVQAKLPTWFATYDQQFRQAAREDATRQVAGKSFRMGG